jgi:C4-dicarboxylate-specific signal transduction histidine kinase
MVHPEDMPRVKQAFDQAVSKRNPYEAQYRIVRRDGTIRHLEALGHPVLNETGEVAEYIGKIIDVTERKQAEEAMHSAQTELAQFSRAIVMGELAASIAHEVNQPLAAVVTSGNAGLTWLAGAAPNLEEARVCLERIIRDGKRAADVIARIRALLSQTEMSKERLDINEAIQEVAALAQAELRRNAVALRMDLTADLPPILGDRVQLQQVMLNLIMNGIEAMSMVMDRPAELMITTQRHEADAVRVRVADCGAGIDSERMKRIFDRFYTTKVGGLGMGLSISRSIIEAHGGRLWATQNAGPGAMLQFTLPIYDAKKE